MSSTVSSVVFQSIFSLYSYHDDLRFYSWLFAVSYAATAVFFYVWVLPIFLYLVCAWKKSTQISFLEILCVYGYSLCIYVPISVSMEIFIEPFGVTSLSLVRQDQPVIFLSTLSLKLLLLTMRIKYLCRRWRLRHATTVSHYPLQSLTDTHVSRKTPSISRRSQRWYVLHAVQSSSRSKEYAYVQSPALLVVGEPQFRTAGDSTTKKDVVFHGMNTTQVQAFCLKGKMISCKYWFCSYLGIPYKNVQTWNVRTWKWQVFFLICWDRPY